MAEVMQMAGGWLTVQDQRMAEKKHIAHVLAEQQFTSI